jgi:hypothetical protein
MRSLYGAARLKASSCCFCERALAPSELRLFSHWPNEVLAFLGRAMSDRAGARPYQLNVRRRSASLPVATASANQIVEPRAFLPDAGYVIKPGRSSATEM